MTQPFCGALLREDAFGSSCEGFWMPARRAGGRRHHGAGIRNPSEGQTFVSKNSCIASGRVFPHVGLVHPVLVTLVYLPIEELPT